jgi:hypothetical protein
MVCKPYDNPSNALALQNKLVLKFGNKQRVRLRILLYVGTGGTISELDVIKRENPNIKIWESILMVLFLKIP